MFESISPETWAALADLALSIGDEDQASVLIDEAFAACDRLSWNEQAEAA